MRAWRGEPAQVDSNQPKANPARFCCLGKGGHTFGDELSEQERMELIEYLKTL
jgi:hypothetical protein